MEDLSHKAIKLALACDWEGAIEINLLILKKDISNVDCLNRLAKAYFEKGLLTKAKQVSAKVLLIDKNNSIAKKALQKYLDCKKNKKDKCRSNSNIDPSIFIEEIGKTKSTTLLNPGSKAMILAVSAGDELKLSVHSHRVTVTTIDGSYLGKVADNLSARLRLLIKTGNKYRVFAKSSFDSCLKIIIREEYRSVDFRNSLSFPPENLESLSESSTNFDN